MGLFTVKVTGISTGASAGSYITILGLKLANTTGHRARLRRLVIGGGGGAAQDIQVDVKFDRTDNTGDGTSTSVATTTILAHDQLGVASNIAAIGKNYSAEPTTYAGDAGAGGSFNSRGTLVLEWASGQGPGWGLNQTLGLLATPGANTATTLSVDLTWEE